ncbi:NAD(P)/FAD-dependent oxidoreductase [Ochrobactrum quorumnocens]|uniref:FAD/NAD(P)-dependent oxidoreductase n=1 Tax=Ochrobactrum quorumnocens TaxID=271865 RepID=UPI0038532488
MAIKKNNDISNVDPFYDVAIVGAGPAGMAAATEASARGARTILFDENPAVGGQIYRSIENNTPSRRAFLGKDYWRGKAILTAFLASDTTYVGQALVWSVEQQRQDKTNSAELRVSKNGQSRIMRVKRVIFATGALERPMPVPGWTLPGVMTIGAAQIALKASGLLPDAKVVLAGTGPLLYLFAAQVLEAGGTVAAILDTTPRRNWTRAMPYLPSFLLSSYAFKGLSLLNKVRRFVSIHSNVEAIEILGVDKATGVRFTAKGLTQEVDIDSIFLHQGVIPNNNLSNATGCELVWNERQKCFQPKLDEYGRSSLETVFVAGDGGGIGGALVAETSGRIAALAVCRELFTDKSAEIGSALTAAKRSRRKLTRGRSFIDTLYQPSLTFRAPLNRATIVCRCEEVTVGEIRDAAALNVAGPNQLKTMLRCGMGPCQGRMCAATITEILADTQHRTPEAVGTYRLRMPVKPVPLREIAALPHTPDAIFAVTGENPAEL